MSIGYEMNDSVLDNATDLKIRLIRRRMATGEPTAHRGDVRHHLRVRAKGAHERRIGQRRKLPLHDTEQVAEIGIHLGEVYAPGQLRHVDPRFTRERSVGRSRDIELSK